MLKRLDRVQIAVADLSAAESVVGKAIGGELLRRDEVPPLGAKRSTMQAGTSLIELLQPDGAGAVKDFFAKWGGGLFGVGFSVGETEEAERQFEKVGVKFEKANGQLFLDPAATFGMRTVISRHHERAPIGAIKWAYEVTNLVGDWKAAADRYAKIFALDAAKFSPIASKEYGYTGTLTLLNPPERLDRVEIAQINDPNLAMGRFHRKRGDSLYMFFAESDDVQAIADRLDALGARYQPNRPDEAGLGGLFIHPSAFLGVLVGISRTENAWLWSGDPERAKRAAKARAARK
ncbi:MAG: VOC family protein [Candidatus Binataceae bacterium]